MPTRCRACPIDPARPCWAARLASPHVCGRVAEGGDYARLNAERSASLAYGWSGPPDTPHPGPSADPPPWAAVPGRSVPGAVSVVVAARNYAPYLRDALESALRQRPAPLEVLYSDDGSTDDSLEVARSVPGVTVLPPAAHAGVAAARNRAAAMARGEYLLHLDGDDLLPPGYLASRLDALARNPSAAFAYGEAQEFGAASRRWPVHPWEAGGAGDAGSSYARLLHLNWINTSTLVRADAFRSAGGWREGIGTAWDWDLWLRMARAGFAGVACDSPADPPLLYRRHAASVSVADRDGDAAAGFATFGRNAHMARLSHLRTAIGCVLSGRLPGLLPAWLDAIGATIAHHDAALAAERPYGSFGRIDAPAPSLHLLYTGPKSGLPAVRDALAGRMPAGVGEWSLTVAPQAELPPASRGEARSHAVSATLAAAYNRLLRIMGDGPDGAGVAWWVEDDILVPPNALHDLKDALLSPAIPRPAVAGWYRARHGDPYLLAHDWPGRRRGAENGPESIRAVDAIPAGVPGAHADLTGTGCLMVLRPFAPHGFAPTVGGRAAHDWRWCLDLADAPAPAWRAGEDRRPLMVASVKCRHHRTEREWVDVDGGAAPPGPEAAAKARAELAASKAARECPARFDPVGDCKCTARCRRLGGRVLSLRECTDERLAGNCPPAASNVIATYP